MPQLRVALSHHITTGKYHIIGSGGNGAAQQVIGHLLHGGAGAVHGNGKATVFLFRFGGKALTVCQTGQVLYGDGIIHGDGKRLAAGIHFFFCHHNRHGTSLAFSVNMIHNSTSCVKN